MNDEQSALFLFEEAMSFTYAAALRVAAEIRVADCLSSGPRSAAELAEATGTHPGHLHRVLRLLAARGVLGEDSSGQFHLTALGDALRTDAAVPALSGVLMFTDQMFWTLTHEVTTILRACQPLFGHVFGISMKDYFAQNPDIEELFYDGIEKVSDAENPLVVRSYDFPRDATVVDVGGRFGAFLLALLRAYPGLYGVLFDQEPVLQHHRLGVPDLVGRWKTAAGDFFTEVPAGDVYVIKRNLHALDDAASIRLLQTCRRAMNSGGRVLVIDAIIPAGNKPHLSKCMDFMMLANLVGKERTAAELDRLFEAAGLRLNRVISTPTVMSIAEGVAR